MLASRSKHDKEEVPSMAIIMRQVNRMVAFIELEGTEKADAIANKTEEEYHLIVGNDVQNGRRQLVELYDKKLKALAKEQNIKDQLLKNESKMILFRARQEMMLTLIKEIEERIVDDVNNKDHRINLLKSTLSQSIQLLLEKEVIVQVVERDANSIDKISDDVLKELKNVSGIVCKIRVAKKHLSDKLIGGCVVYNRRCTVKVSNTVYDRFTLIISRLMMSGLRAMLFGKNDNRIHDT